MENVKDRNLIGRPNHSVLSKDKTPHDYYKPCADYYKNQTDGVIAFHQEADRLHKIAGGYMPHGYYSHVLNPTNTTNEDFTRYPANLRNYDIISPILNLFLGENRRKRVDPSVFSVNSDSVSSFKKAKDQLMAKLLAQDFVNYMNANNYDTGVPTKEVPDYKEAIEEFDNGYSDRRAEIGQEALDYLRYDLDFAEKEQQMLYDWMVVGCVVTWKDVYMDDVDYEVCDIRDIHVIGLPANGYIQDAEAVVRDSYMTRSEIYDNFNKELEDKNPFSSDNSTYREEIDNRTFGSVPHIVVQVFNETMDGVSDNGHTPYSVMDEERALVQHVVWQGRKKVGVLSYIDSKTGQVAYLDVDDTYALDKTKGDIEIEWEWINWWNETYIIDGSIYLRMRGGQVQRHEINNNSRNKLPYNGKIRGYRSGSIMSIVKIGLPYQILYNIIHFRFEFSLAKNKDKITIMPFGIIPRKAGWDEDKWFYWASVHGIGWVDESAPGFANAIQAMKALDMGLGTYIESMWRLLSEIKNEFWDNIGVNRQRYGDSMASDGKGTTEQAIFRSALITEDMFAQLDDFKCKEYEGLLDYSKLAWVDGKKGVYMNSDNRVVFFQVEGTEYMETEFGVFVGNTKDTHDKLEKAKALLQTMGQNTLGADGMLAVSDASSMSKAKGLAKKAMDIERKFQEKQNQDVLASNERVQEMVSQDKMRESEDKRYVADTGANAEIESAYISATGNLAKIYSDTINKNKELMESLGTDTMSKLDARYAELRSDLQERKLANDNKKIDANLAKAANDLKIARENRNKHDNAR